MTKKALCVGINKYPQEGMDLRGCVNDANDWANVLADHYDFARTDIEVVLDQDATHDVVLGKLKVLLAGASAGDVLVFTNSSHGTYLADTDNDEPTYDEAMCPYDTQDNPIVDDELRVLFADIPAGVRMTVISDSCHSGTVTRAMPTPDMRRPRFLSPSTLGRKELTPKQLARGRAQHPQSDMREVLLSGCKPNQFSYDATIEGAPHGAFTFYALAAIRAASYQITYAELHKKAVAALRANEYPQQPQLEGASANLSRQIFT